MLSTLSAAYQYRSGRLGAFIGRTICVATSDLAKEWRGAGRTLPDFHANREKTGGEKFIGSARDRKRLAARKRESLIPGVGAGVTKRRQSR